MAELAALGLRERVLAEASERGVQHSDLGWVLLYAFRRRLEEALRRRTTLEAGDHPMLAVGFVDLVDFTRTSGSMQTDELGRLLGRFEALASDVITEAGGSVVKLIGDEAMLVFPTADQAARGAIELVDACAAGDARDRAAWTQAAKGPRERARLAPPFSWPLAEPSPPKPAVPTPARTGGPRRSTRLRSRPVTTPREDPVTFRALAVQ